ncbi:MAG: hypothetical protein MZW92_35780 [Comamonadaceae bacterium]|nr:hypothetical protein [Comamonadaceae bacterium]
MRLLRAYAVRLQWSQYRHWPVSDLFWQNVGRAYLYALDNGYVRREISVYPGDREQTNVSNASICVPWYSRFRPRTVCCRSRSRLPAC